MLSSFKSVYVVVCENFVSPTLLYNLSELLSFQKITKVEHISV